MANRRGKGEGSISQRPDGLWVARINIGTDATGKRLRKAVYGHTKKEVADKLTKLAHQKLDGTLIDTGRMTVGDLLDKYLEDSAQRRAWKPMRKAAGIAETVVFHDLRHTSASLLLATGAHPKVVQERLGHSKISLTMDTYSHLMPGMQDDAAAKLDTALRVHSA